MAQADGAIRIVTKITTKDAEESLSSLEWQIKKSAKDFRSHYIFYHFQLHFRYTPYTSYFSFSKHLTAFA